MAIYTLSDYYLIESTTIATLTYSTKFNTAGTKLYTVRYADNNVYEYPLSTAWDITTIGTASTYSIVSQTSNPIDVGFNDVGTKMYITDSVAKLVYQYTLSTAWDVTSSSYASLSFSMATEISGSNFTLYGLSFKSDGTEFYVLHRNNSDVLQYTMSTAWNISTATYTNLYDVATQETDPRGVSFKSDGTKMYVGGSGSGGDIFQYSLSTAWDVTTATYDSVTLDTSSVGNPYGLFIPDGGVYLYTLTDGELTQYYHSPRLTISTDSLCRFDIITVYANELSYVNKSFSVATQTTAPVAIFLNPTSTEMYIFSETAEKIFQYTLSAAGDVSTASYTTSLDVSTDVIAAHGLSFNLDGTKMYPTNGTNVFQYTLSSAWDLDTATYDSVYHTLSGDGIYWSDDGTKIFTHSSSTTIIYQYTLGTAWDITTLSSFSASESYDVTQITSGRVHGFVFSNDGSQMIVTGTDDMFYQFTLRTAWDLKTARYTNLSKSSTPAVYTEAVFYDAERHWVYLVDSNTDVVDQYSFFNDLQISTKNSVSLVDTGTYHGIPSISTKATGTFFPNIYTALSVLSKSSISLVQTMIYQPTFVPTGKVTLALLGDSVLKTTTLGMQVLPTYAMALPTGIKNTSAAITTKSSINLDTVLITDNTVNCISKSSMSLLGTRSIEYSINMLTKSATSLVSVAEHPAMASFTTKSAILVNKDLTLRAICGIITKVTMSSISRRLYISTLSITTRASIAIVGNIHRQSLVICTSKSNVSLIPNLVLQTSTESRTKASISLFSTVVHVTPVSLGTKSSVNMVGTWRDSTSASFYPRSKVSFNAVPSYFTYLENENNTRIINYLNSTTLILKS